MIYPAPPGIKANRYMCGECGAGLAMPWMETAKDAHGYNFQIYALKCVNNSTHETYVEKNNGRTKTLSGPDGLKIEVDVMTQRPTTGADIVLIESEASALAVVKRQNSLATWPDSKDMNESQMAALAHVAYHYQMDIIMGEIMPFQGKPFITIKGRRRHDKREGHRMGITFRMPREDELQFWMTAGAMKAGDLIQIAVGTEPDGLVTEAMGRVLASEKPATAKGQEFLPIEVRKLEMAQKRAESRLREMVFGAIGKPQGLNLETPILSEGEGVGIIEGTYREIPQDQPESEPMPDFGDCPEHGVEWRVEADKYTGAPRAAHPVGQSGPWCNISKVYAPLFMSAWAAKFGEPNKKDVDAWLKERYDGKTWSKLAHLECIEAFDTMRVDDATGEVEAQPEPQEESIPMPDYDEQEPELVGDEAGI